jgi:DHA1 family tetracycline resistance protein-like MFS transporter
MTSVSTTPSTASEKLDFKRILPIFIIVVVDLMGLTIIIPLLPLYATALGASALIIGVLSATYPISQLIGGPLLGGLSDRYGRRPILIISQFGTFIGFLILGFANSLPLLFLSRLIDGLTGGNIVVAQAAISDSTTERTRTQGLGLIGAAFGLGFILGPALAGISLSLSGGDYRVPAFIAAGFSLISIFLTSLWFKETLPEGGIRSRKAQQPFFIRLRSALNTPVIGALLVLMFMQQLVFGGFEQFLSLFTLTRLGMNGAGNAVLFIFIGFIVVIVQARFIGPWSRKYGERRLIYFSLLLLTVGLILTSLTPAVAVPWYSQSDLLAEFARSSAASGDIRQALSSSIVLPDDSARGWLGLLWILAAMIPASIGGAMLAPSINSLITKFSAPDSIGSMLGVSSALVSLANAVTPILGGMLFQVLGSTAPFLLGGLLMAGLLLMALRYVVSPPREMPHSPMIPS